MRKEGLCDAPFSGRPVAENAIGAENAGPPNGGGAENASKYESFELKSGMKNAYGMWNVEEAQVLLAPLAFVFSKKS